MHALAWSFRNFLSHYFSFSWMVEGGSALGIAQVEVNRGRVIPQPQPRYLYKSNLLKT